MGKTREIKKRIKAVGNIRRITKTMQMIATSKFARAQQRATSSKPYTEGVFELVRKIAATAGGAGGSISHPLIAGPTETPKVAPKKLTLIITSDRGLCGPYNGSVLRTAMAYLRKTEGAKGGEIELIGRKGAAFLKFNAMDVSQVHAIGDKPTFDQIEKIAQTYMDRFIKGEIASVHVISMRFYTIGRQKPEATQLLPLQPPANTETASSQAGKAEVEFEFSPKAEVLLGTLLPAATKAMLAQIINDAIVSEHIARMVAMKSATDNAGKMGKSLTRQYNRARQAQITTELTEIISGAAALE